MMRSFFLILLVFFPLIKSNADLHKHSAAATSAPIASLVSIIAGDKMNISVFQHSGSCMHHMHLKPKDIEFFESKDFLIYSSDEFEPIIAKVKHKGKLPLMNLDSIGHFWLSLEETKNTLNRLTNKLIEIIPEKKEIFSDNLKISLTNIEKLEKQIQDIVDRNSSKNLVFIILSKNELANIFNQFKIKYIYKNPTNISESQEIIDLTKKENYRLIITQHYLSHKLEKFISQNKIIKLDTENWEFDTEKELENLYFKEILKIIEKLYA
jgi:ABC-type Zn uptake system ZnuABC Zn-binding protein ZnuA